MEINDIHKWLRSDRNYTIGVQIYSELGSSQTYKDLFAKFENSHTKAQLLSKMQELAIKFPEEKLVIVSKVKKKRPQVTRVENYLPKKKNSELVDFSKLPPEILKLHTENGEIVRKTGFLRNLLFNCPSDQRYSVAKQIVDNHDKVIENWMHIDYYNQNQEILELKERKETDKRFQQRIPDENKMRILLSLRTQISKVKKKIKDNPDQLALKDKLKDLELKKNLLKKEING